MRILITGGAGFIGSWIATHLEGHQILVMDDLSGGYRRNVDGWPLQQFSLVDSERVSSVVGIFKPDTIVHCAAFAAEALSHWMRRYCYTENLLSWANLANAAVDNNVGRLVVLSSFAVYGDEAPPFTEDMPCRPVDPYGVAKTAMESDVRILAELHGMSTLIVRPHNVYGPRQNLADPYRNVVAIFMRQALAGEPITVYGDGLQTRAFSYVEDVSQAIARLAVSDVETTVNIGGEDPITVLELAERVKALTGSSSEIVNLPPRHEVADAYCNHDRLRGLLGGWDPTPLDVGLGRMAEWAKTVQVGRLRSYDYETDAKIYEPWRR